ncbi:MAG: GxxExxY protein [Spartobacteria bacterium]|nr:GxxExxY protein [Spartobacteria bacterium]
MDLNELTGRIIQAAIEVHNTLGGPGLLESVYEEALVYELESSGMKVDRQVPVPINYKGKELGTPLRVDLLVEDKAIVECKAVSENNPIFESQVLTYLRLSERKVGLVLNFGQRYIKDGLRRVANGFDEGDAATAFEKGNERRDAGAQR